MSSPNIQSLPTFPESIELGPSHRELITDFTSRQGQLPSDFNFHSLLAWSIDGRTTIANLNGNLVVDIPDYMNGEPSVTVYGDQSTDQTVHTLLGFTDKLVYVPEVVVDNLSDRSGLCIQEDRDNFDYIYDIADLVALPGSGSNKGKRNRISKFQRIYGSGIEVTHMPLASAEGGFDQDIMGVVEQWQQIKCAGSIDGAGKPETKAVERLLKLGSEDVLHISRLCIENSCVGFSINELLPDGNNSLCHFQKVIPGIEHADLYLNHEVSKYLGSLGCTTVNWEQDLGIPGLRYLKESYHPTSVIKKYTITSMAASMAA